MMNKLYIFTTLCCLFTQPLWGQIRDFQTTRLISTGGAGVASVLSTEAAVLNPASASFFVGSSASYQRNTTRLRSKDDIRDTPGNGFADKNQSEGFFLSDHSGPVKGGLAYLTQHENNYQRERIVLHGGSTFGDRTSIGFSYRYTQDKRPSSFSRRHNTFHQQTFGLLHIIDSKTTLGLVVIDPFITNSGDERAIAGFQYYLAERISLIGDAGFQFTKAIEKKYLWRGAVQLNIFDDFFLRAGLFYDNVTEFKGTSWGASWIGPRLGVEFAQKFSEQIGQGGYIYAGESLVDTSLSAIIKF